MKETYRIYAHTRTDGYELISQRQNDAVALKLVRNMIYSNEDYVSYLIIAHNESYDYPYGLFHRDERSLEEIEHLLADIKENNEGQSLRRKR